MFGPEDVIYSYTRAQALEDGVLIDVSARMKEAGLSIPTAITAGLQAETENIPPSKFWQDPEGRLWDVIWMTSLRLKSYWITHANEKVELPYTFYHKIIMHCGRKTYFDLKVVGHKDEDLNDCITIMLPHED